MPVLSDEVYTVIIAMWPANVAVDAGNRLTLETSSGDTADAGLFTNDGPVDR
jgi:hypothetical protein